MMRRGFTVGVAGALLLSFLIAIGGCGSDTGSGSGGSSGATGGRSGGGGGGAGGRSGGAGGTGGTFTPDGGLPDGFGFDGIDFDAIAADLGITSCPGGVTGGASCTSGTDQACRPASGGNLCICQGSGTWNCF